MLAIAPFVLAQGSSVLPQFARLLHQVQHVAGIKLDLPVNCRHSTQSIDKWKAGNRETNLGHRKENCNNWRRRRRTD